MNKTISTLISVALLSLLTKAHGQSSPLDTTSSNETASPKEPEKGKKDDKKREVIAVTGTRIKRMDMDVATPVTVVGKDEIAASGKQTVTDIVKTLPAAVGNSVSTTTTNGGGEGSGNIALRGLDASSTLVLLNGRRLPLDSSGSSPDLNSIPVAAIERIEILQDGASAIYGSDAIAGVINIITRKDYDGLDFNIYFGQSSRGDLKTRSIDLSYGVTNDKGSLLLGVNSYSQGKIHSRDREVSKQSLHPSAATPNAHVTIDDKTDLISKPAWSGTKATPDEFNKFTSQDKYNFSSITDAVMAQNRKSIFIGGDHNFSEHLKGFVESHFTQTYSTYDSAPTPVFLSQETGNLKVSKDNIFNGFEQDLSDVKKRMLQFGPRTSESHSDTSRTIVGVQGDWATWNWDLAYNKGESQVRSGTKNLVNKTNLQLGIGDPSHCAAVSNLGCVDVNILGPDGSLTDAMVDWLKIASTSQTQTLVDSYTLNFTNDTIDSPLGKFGVAIGAEYRKEGYNNTPDSNSQSYNTIGSTNGKATEGNRSVREAYLEFTLPVKSIAEINLATRYSDYSDFGGTSNPKIGLKVFAAPGLTLRGSYSKGFRAPSLVELYQGQVENFAQLSDPCQEEGAPNCTKQADPNISQFLALQGGNPKLEPEKSTSFTYGLAYNLSSFNAKVDYFQIETKNAIQTDPQFVIDQFRNNGLFKDKVKVDENNNITQIEATALNLSTRKVEGVDLAFDYALRKTATGNYFFNLMGSHYIKYLNQADKSAPLENVVGKYSDAANGGRGSIPKWKGMFDATWSGEQNIDAGFTANYVSSLTASDAETYTQLDAWKTYDIHAGYSWLQYGKLTVGVNNVLDAKPPVTDGAYNDNIDARTHNLIGRFYYARWGVQL